MSDRIIDAVNTIHDQRENIDLAKIYDVETTGRRGGEFDEHLDRALELLAEEELVHKPWLDRKINGYIEEGWLTVGEALTGRDSFNYGLTNYLITQFRLYKSLEDKVLLADFGTKENLEAVVLSYSMDFFRALTVCKSLGLNGPGAISVASRVYKFEPTYILQLKEKYPDVTNSTLITAITRGIKDPIASLNRFETLMQGLQSDPMYSDLPPYLIQKACIGHPNNPKGFLKGVAENFRLLTSQHKNLELPNWVYQVATDRLRSIYWE